MTFSEPFDLEEYRTRRSNDLARHNEYLEGELERCRSLLIALLRMAAQTTGLHPIQLLDAAIASTGTDPALAHIHQPEQPWTHQ